MTQDSSYSGESPRPNFDESHPVHSTRVHCCVKCRENCLEQVDEHLFFDYFRKHVGDSCTESSPDSGCGQNVLAATSSSCQQEKSALPDHLASEGNKSIARIEEPNDRGKNDEAVLMKCDFTISKDSKLDLDAKVVSLDVHAEKQQDEEETSGDQREMQSPDLNFPKENVDIAKESGNTDMKRQHEPRDKESEICLEFQNTVTLPQGRNKLHNTNALKFPELQLKDSDELGTLENTVTQENPNGDFPSGSKATANSSEFHLKHFLKSVCRKDDLLHDLIKFEKEMIAFEVDKITNECMKNIFSKVLINKFNSSLESWRNEFLTTGNEVQVHKKIDILPRSSKADILSGMDARLEVLKVPRSSSIETVFNDFVQNRAAEGKAQKSYDFPDANVPKEPGNPGGSLLGQSSNCIRKDDPGAEKITTGDEAETFMKGELIVFTSVNDWQETDGMENNCFEDESNQCFKGELKTDFQDPGAENKPLVNAGIDFEQLKEFDPLTERFTIDPSSATKGDYAGTAELEMMGKWFVKPYNRVMSVVPEKEELSGDRIADVLRQMLTCQAREIASTVKPGGEFDSKKCFTPENVKDEFFHQKQVSAGNEAPDGKQLINIPFDRTISTLEPGIRFDPKIECVKFENREVKNREKVGNEEPSSYEVQKCEYSVTSSTTGNSIIEGTVKTRREVKRNKSSKFQLFGKMNDEKCSADASTLPSNATIENKFEGSQAQDSDTIVDKSTRKWLNSVMFGSCFECEDEQQSERGDSACRIPRKDSDRQTHHKDRRCRSKSKKRTETKRKPLNLTKTTDKNLMTKRVAFLEKSSVFSYDPNESILEGFRNHAKAGKMLERTSRSRERSMDKTQSSLKKMTSKPTKKSTPTVRKRSTSPKRNVFKNLRDKGATARKEMRGQANVEEQRHKHKKTVVPACESDFQNVILDGTEGYVNPAFEDVPAYDCILDLERKDSASIDATFDEDRELLSGEGTPDDDKFDAIRLKEMGRHAECSIKRWIRDSLLSSKRLSFKKMKAALRKK